MIPVSVQLALCRSHKQCVFHGGSWADCRKSRFKLLIGDRTSCGFYKRKHRVPVNIPEWPPNQSPATCRTQVYPIYFYAISKLLCGGLKGLVFKTSAAIKDLTDRGPSMSPIVSIRSADHYPLLCRSDARCRSMSLNTTLCTDGPDKGGAPAFFFFFKKRGPVKHSQTDW